MNNFNLKYLLLLGLLIISLAACNNTNEVLGPSIFDTVDHGLDSTSYSFKFDSYLNTNFLKPYNLSFIYKMEDKGTDMNYNLVPATYENSQKMAVLIKYLWFDVYGKMVNPEFLKSYGPRVIQLIGSPAYNPVNGTMLLGLAEGGMKISLFRVNELDITDIETLNEFYFKTMHHEFAHILHQKKTYPKEFNLISYASYEPFSWQDRDERVAQSLGFVSPYAGSQTREDFVETIANYIVKTDAQWNTILTNASKGWVVSGTTVTEGTDTDGVDGKAVILQKLSICRTWLKDSWNIDIDLLRQEVQTRQANINMTVLLNPINN
ncbi:MAG: putative zinc-binding metallopeptidase [Paludibacter sp.]